MREETRGERVRWEARRIWGKLRWRLALLHDVTAFLVLDGAIGGGIYAAITTANAWPGAWVAAAGVLVLVAWVRANAASYRYRLYWWRGVQERQAMIARDAERIIEED